MTKDIAMLRSESEICFLIFELSHIVDIFLLCDSENNLLTQLKHI